MPRMTERVIGSTLRAIATLLFAVRTAVSYSYRLLPANPSEKRRPPPLARRAIVACVIKALANATRERSNDAGTPQGGIAMAVHVPSPDQLRAVATQCGL